MISRFCIDRPIFAAVLSLSITLAGFLALLSLPVAGYPEVTPPTVQVTCTYPGGSAAVVADTVAAPIEQQVNGVENMLYMSSQSGNDGSYTLTVTFELGTDLDTALVMVQNRVALAMPQLPNAVRQQGLTIRKKTPDLLLLVNFISPDGRYDNLYLSNYATIQVQDELLRVPRRLGHWLPGRTGIQHSRLARSAEIGSPQPHGQRGGFRDPGPKQRRGRRAGGQVPRPAP